ncbi:Abi-alpha family protein [Candidatus Enterenecus avicola]
MVKIGANDNSFNLISINVDAESINNLPLAQIANTLFNKVFSKPIEYQIVRKAELKKLEKDANKYFNQTPDQYRDNSKLGLTLKTIEDSQYQLSSDDLREMFARLIVKTMDSRFNTEIPPAFSDILKNLSIDEAALCKSIFSLEHNVLPLFEIKLSNYESFSPMDLLTDNSAFEIPINDTYLIWSNKVEEIDKLTISLLGRSGIIEDAFYFNESHAPGLPQAEKIKQTEHFHLIARNFQNFGDSFSKDEPKIVLKERYVRFTPLGKKLMDLCLKD